VFWTRYARDGKGYDIFSGDDLDEKRKRDGRKYNSVIYTVIFISFYFLSK